MSVFGPVAAKTWLREFGMVTSAVLAAGITAIYVVVVHEQLKTMSKVTQLRYGAGSSGPKVEICQEDRQAPPSLRIEAAYQYPNEYRSRALPREQSEPERERVEESIGYEIIRISNRSGKPVHSLLLDVRLKHDSEARTFRYEHVERIDAGKSIEIGVWPVKSMPKYTVRVTGTYVDDVGEFALMECEVSR